MVICPMCDEDIGKCGGYHNSEWVKPTKSVEVKAESKGEASIEIKTEAEITEAEIKDVVVEDSAEVTVEVTEVVEAPIESTGSVEATSENVVAAPVTEVVEKSSKRKKK